MTEDSARWIWIPHWQGDDDHPGFQHYKDRDPVWIKNYRYLLRDDHYLDLHPATRGLLHGLWLATAAAGNGRIPYRAMAIRRHLGLGETFRLRQLDPLIQAGFIDVRASEGLAERYQPASPEVEKRRERKERAREAAAENGGSRRPENKTAPLGENGLPIMTYAEYEKTLKEMP